MSFDYSANFVEVSRVKNIVDGLSILNGIGLHSTDVCGNTIYVSMLCKISVEDEATLSKIGWKVTENGFMAEMLIVPERKEG